VTYCVSCGAPLSEGARFCASCGTATQAPPAAPIAAREALPEELVPSAPQPGTQQAANDQTVVERVLGGSWLPALRVALPVLLITAGLAALTAATQLWAHSGSFRIPLVQLVPNNVGAYFHSVAQQMASSIRGTSRSGRCPC
jgi:hypothetical protein